MLILLGTAIRAGPEADVKVKQMLLDFSTIRFEVPSSFARTDAPEFTRHDHTERLTFRAVGSSRSYTDLFDQERLRLTCSWAKVAHEEYHSVHFGGALAAVYVADIELDSLLNRVVYCAIPFERPVLELRLVSDHHPDEVNDLVATLAWSTGLSQYDQSVLPTGWRWWRAGLVDFALPEPFTTHSYVRCQRAADGVVLQIWEPGQAFPMPTADIPEFPTVSDGGHALQQFPSFGTRAYRLYGEASGLAFEAAGYEAKALVDLWTSFRTSLVTRR